MPRAVNGWKICSRCKKNLPVSSFPTDKRKPDGCKCWCSRCSLRYKQRRYNQTPRPVFADSPGNRQCSSCKEIKPATVEFFTPAKGRVSGLQRECRVCRYKKYLVDKAARPSVFKSRHQRDSRRIKLEMVTVYG